MRDVVLEIGETKKDFEDFFVVGGISIELALRERVDGVWRVGEEPGEDFFVDQACFNAPGAHLIRAFDYQFEEMIEANTIDRQGRKDFFSAAVHIAPTSHRVSAFPAREGDGQGGENHTPVLALRVRGCAGEETECKRSFLVHS